MKRLLVILAATCAVLAVGAGIAYASIPAPDGTIHGCYKNSTGMLIAIDSSASCPTGYTALNWSQTGPQGPAGTNGTNGTNGVSGYQVETCNLSGSGSTSLCTDTSSGGVFSGTLSCPTGKTAISESNAAPHPLGNAAVYGGAAPTSDGTGYDFLYYTFGSPTTSVDVYVTCVYAS